MTCDFPYEYSSEGIVLERSSKRNIDCAKAQLTLAGNSMLNLAMLAATNGLCSVIPISRMYSCEEYVR